MAGKGPFVVEAWAPWKIWGGHLPTPDPPQMAPLQSETFITHYHQEQKVQMVWQL